MKTLPKFLIAHNVTADSDAIYVVHTQNPRFIGKVLPISGDMIQIDKIMQQYKFEAGCRTNRLPTGEFYIMGVVMWIDKGIDNEFPKLMSRTGDWLFN